MRMSMRRDAERIVSQAIQAVQPDAAVRQALWGRHLSGRVVLVAVGKAAWQMALPDSWSLMQCVRIEGTYHFHSLTFTVHPYSALGLDGCKPICA